VNLSFEKSGESLDGMSLIIDTEAIRYKWRGADGQFPDYEKLMPTEANTTAHFDTVEAGKAIASLKALAGDKSYPIDLTLDGGYITMTSPDDKGQVTIPADIEGIPGRVRIEGGYLAAAMRACGGMVDFSMTDGKSPCKFTTDGYQLVVMPMLTAESKPKAEARAEAEPVAEPAEAEAEKAQAVAEAEAVVAKAEAEKPKRKRKVKEPVAV
jgi:DNA polymerase III sliding clamp (beta) subunit (PCNA family)